MRLGDADHAATPPHRSATSRPFTLHVVRSHYETNNSPNSASKAQTNLLLTTTRHALTTSPPAPDRLVNRQRTWPSANQRMGANWAGTNLVTQPSWWPRAHTASSASPGARLLMNYAHSCGFCATRPGPQQRGQRRPPNHFSLQLTAVSRPDPATNASFGHPRSPPGGSSHPAQSHPPGAYLNLAPGTPWQRCRPIPDHTSAAHAAAQPDIIAREGTTLPAPSAYRPDCVPTRGFGRTRFRYLPTGTCPGLPAYLSVLAYPEAAYRGLDPERRVGASGIAPIGRKSDHDDVPLRRIGILRADGWHIGGRERLRVVRPLSEAHSQGPPPVRHRSSRRPSHWPSAQMRVA
jgi:hypothetical protein